MDKTQQNYLNFNSNKNRKHKWNRIHNIYKHYDSISMILKAHRIKHEHEMLNQTGMYSDIRSH